MKQNKSWKDKNDKACATERIYLLKSEIYYNKFSF